MHIRDRRTILPAAAAAALAAAALAAPVLAQNKSGRAAVPPKPAAKVTPVQAMKSAEAKHGGTARMALFECDEGRWVYGVVILKNHRLLEVDVDPISGAAGDSESVTPDDEAGEFKEQLTSILKG